MERRTIIALKSAFTQKRRAPQAAKASNDHDAPGEHCASSVGLVPPPCGEVAVNVEAIRPLGA